MEKELLTIDNCATENNGGRLRWGWFGLFAAAIALWYFGPFLRNFFVGDDFFSLVGILQGPKAVLVGYDNNLRLFSNIFWWPLYKLFQLNPLGYNIFCLCLHLLNAILLYRLVDLLFPGRQLSFPVAAIFISSSVGADAVLWRAAFATLINAGLYLLILHSHLRYRHSRERRYRYLSLLLFVLAMLTKEEAASLPLVIVLMEVVLYQGPVDFRSLARTVAPFVAIVILTLAGNYLIIHHVLRLNSFMSSIGTIRPLRSLFAGWTVFFLSPEGRLAPTDPRIYATALLIPLSLCLKERRLLLFGYLWVLVTFLPQSFSAQANFHGDELYNSLSRHLYLVSMGSSMVLAILLFSLREKISPRAFAGACLLFFVLHLAIQYPRIQQRGRLWQREGQYVARFISEMQKLFPTLPESTYFSITQPPVGRAFSQAALRAFYRNPNIHWRDDISQLHSLPLGSYGIFIDFRFKDNWDHGTPPKAYVIDTPFEGS